MNTDYLTIIIVNLGILLIASWVLGIVIFSRLLKDKQEAEDALASARKKLKNKKPAQAALDPEDPNYPLAPILKNVTDDESLDLLQAMDALSNDLMEKERQLAALAEFHAKQQALVESLRNEDNNESADELLEHQQETQELLVKLQSELNLSQHQVKELENKLREGQDKDGRIAILEETEKRLRERLDTLKKNQDQATTLADGLRTANDKNKRLQQDNRKLQNNIRQLVNATQEQKNTIKQLTNEVDRIAKLENYQRSVIADLEKNLKKPNKTAKDDAEAKVLEAKLKEVNETLERTVREKDFIESHLLEMDKALENAKETEAALERARKEIETLEMYFPEFTPEPTEEPKASAEAVHEPLPQLTVTEDENPDLFNVVNDNRIFGVLQEFWMTLDTPPLQVVSQENISRPKNLYHWTKTQIDNNIYFIAIGTNKSMVEVIAKAMFKNTDHDLNDNDFNDAMGELGNVLAGTLANELDPEFEVGISENLIESDMIQQLDKVTIAAELLVSANNNPLYIALAKPTGPE